MKGIIVVLTFLSSLLIAPVASAVPDTKNQVNVTMSLKDSQTNEAIEFATVSLQKQGSESVYKYVLSDASGNVRFEGIPSGNYVLKCDLMGYKSIVQNIKVTNTRLDLGQLLMKPDVNMLEGASVTAVGNPIIVKKDTLEYSASSFKTTDNDMLEDLLKKLPGIEVGSDGSITANGETVTKIMIDGRTFFLDDPQLASKNIPANLVEKVKVVEKKSEQAEFTGISDGNEETVIDLSVKKEMMGGWFGNIQAGGGMDLLNSDLASNDARWQGGAMVGNFSKSHQLSIILNANNTNNKGFNDLAGNMMGTLRGGRGMGRGSGGFGQNNGITTSWMGGANGNFTFFDGNTELDGNYMYNGSDTYIEEGVSKTTFKSDGTSLLYDEKGTNITQSQGHRFGFELDQKFSENTSILFRPQFEFGKGFFDENSDYVTQTDISALTGNPSDIINSNSGSSRTSGYSDSWQARGYLLFRQKLGKPGRTLSLSMNYKFSGNDLDGINKSSTLTDLYDENYVHQETREELIDQQYNLLENTKSLGGRLSYTEPIYKQRLFLEATYSYNWSRSYSENRTYNRLPDGTLETIPDPTYSSRLINEYVNQRAGLNLQWQKDGTVFSLGGTAQPNHTMNSTISQGVETITDYNVVNWAPTARIDYRPNDATFWRLFYMGYSSQPTSTQLQPSLNVSNPLLLTLGNAGLDPTFNHMLRSHFRYTNKQTFFTINGMLSGNYTDNSIVNATWYDQAGIQYSIPVNSEGSYSANARVMLNTPIAKSKFSVSSYTNFRYSLSNSFVGNWDMALDAEDFVYSDFIAGFNEAFNDGTSFVRNSTNSIAVSQMLRFTYRGKKLEVNLGANAQYNQAWYSINTEQNTTTWNNNVEASFNYSLPWGFTISSDARYNYYIGYDEGFNEPQLIWNAQIDKLLFKNKFTLSIMAFDILNQSRNVYRTTTDNYVQDTWNNTLGRYIMVSLTYRFGNMGNKQGGPMMGPPMRH